MRIEMSGRRVWTFEGDRDALIQAFLAGRFPGGPNGSGLVVESAQEVRRGADVLLDNEGVFTLYLGDEDYSFDTAAWRDAGAREAASSRVAACQAALEGVGVGAFSEHGDLVALVVTTRDRDAVRGAVAAVDCGTVRELSIDAELLASVPVFPAVRRLRATGELDAAGADALARWGALERLETGALGAWVSCPEIHAGLVPSTPMPGRVRSLVLTTADGFEAARRLHPRVTPTYEVEEHLKMRADLAAQAKDIAPEPAFPAFADGWARMWMDWEILERLTGPIAREWAADLHAIAARSGRPIGGLDGLGDARSTEVATRVAGALSAYEPPAATSWFFGRQAQAASQLVAAICEGAYGNGYLRYVGDWIGTACVASGVRDTWDGSGPVVPRRNVARWDHWVSEARRLERRYR